MSKQIAEIHQMIEKYVQSLGLKKSETYNEDHASWNWVRGSARVEVFITDGGNDRHYFCVYSPLMQVPVSRELEFYKHLLELNFNKLGIKLSVKPDNAWVFAVYERDIEGLAYEELTTCIADLEWWADKLDDELQEKFPH